jgi:hypothetical protein
MCFARESRPAARCKTIIVARMSQVRHVVGSVTTADVIRRAITLQSEPARGLSVPNDSASTAPVIAYP